MLDSEDAAREAVVRFLDRWGDERRYRVIGLIDLGPAWRALVEIHDLQRTIVNGRVEQTIEITRREVEHVDKATGEVTHGELVRDKIGPSAQDGYRAMMRQRVAPEMKRLGFIRSGRTFTLPDTNYLVALSIQGSYANSFMSKRFTANLSVLSRAALAEHEERSGRSIDRFNPDSQHVAWHWRYRLGEISRYGRDHWWELWAGFPFDDVATAFLDAVANFAVPAMRNRMEIESAQNGITGVRPANAWIHPNGSTNLHGLAWKGTASDVLAAISDGCDVNQADYQGFVPLHRAAIGHNIDTATALLSSGANVNAANRWGNTPLHLAAVYERGKQPMVDLLLAHGADPTLRNSDGRTALEGGASAAITESALEALASGEPLLRRD
ncbi:MAG TPA: ankyrin repeat domain-containing protein [Micromonosporaceae bacterium]|jgi:hypothetical protein|nr:ankyrin repeat domain-containing protein [Micromonosporaceae bacterium]